MNRIRFSEFALHDLEEIAEYISQESKTLARRVISGLKGFCSMLGILPELGRPSEIAGVRKLIISRYQYKIIYEIHRGAKEIVILRIYHSTRKTQY